MVIQRNNRPSSPARRSHRAAASSHHAAKTSRAPFVIAVIALIAVITCVVLALTMCRAEEPAQNDAQGAQGEQVAQDTQDATQGNAQDAQDVQDAAQVTPASAPQEQTVHYRNTSKPYSLSFATTGDLIFWREVADYIDANGGASAMANIDDFLAAADVTISNLESPLSDNKSQPVPDKDIYIIGRPSAIESLKNSDITFVSLANNHIMDYTGPALQDTLNALDEAGIHHAGAGMTEDEAGQIAEAHIKGVSIALLSWTDIIPDYYLAHDDEPGVVTARLDMDDACRRVAEAKATHDIVIVSMHWGTEYTGYMSESQQQAPAHQLVDAGADVILGNHPHVAQGIEFYNGALISYAHGNCVFRQSFDFGDTHESYVLTFDMTPDGISNVVATPLYLSDAYGIPEIATGEQAMRTLNRVQAISDGLNTTFDIRDNVAYLSPADGSGPSENESAAKKIRERAVQKPAA